MVPDAEVDDMTEEPERKDGELAITTETLRRTEKELSELKVVYHGLLGGVDRRDRELLLATDTLQALETDLREARRVGEGLRGSLAVKDRDLRLAMDEIGLLRGDRRRLESRARAHRTRIVELEGLADALLEDVALLLKSRRWRLGHFVLSMPRRLLGRRRPATVADHLEELGRAYVRGAEELAIGSSGPVSVAERYTAGPTASSGARRPPGRKQITILVLAWDIGHNPLGRAYLLAEALQRSYTVVLAGFQFPRYGHDVWKPLRDAPFRIVRIRGESFPDFQRTAEALAGRLDPDVVIACKARLPAVQTGLMWKASRNRPLLIDVDDYELSFFANREPLADPSRETTLALAEPFEEAWTRYTEKLLPFADGLLVSNSALQRRFGGVVVPHARDETSFNPDNFNRDAIRAGLALGTDRKVILFVGTPRPHKGVLSILDAVKSLGREDYCVAIVGTPPDKVFAATLRARGGDALRLFPDLPFDQLPAITVAADLVCLLQDPDNEIAQYQLPAKVVDAMAMCVPVLATDVPPLRELIRLGAIEPVSKDNLAERISWWLDGAGDAERNAQVDRARSAYIRLFSYQSIHRTLFNEIERCLAAPKSLPVEAVDFLASQARRYPRAEGETDNGLDLVMFWKQGDVGLYGRRFDMLVHGLAQRAEIRHIAIFDAPFSVYQVLRDHVADTTVHHQNVAENKLIRRWGLADQGKVTHHVFLFDNRRAMARDRYPHMSEFGDFVTRELDGLGIDPGGAVFWYYPVLEQIEALGSRFNPRLKVVDVVDDQRAWPDRTEDDRAAMTRHYRAVVEDADLVLANCETVRETMSAYGRDVALIPNGCDVDPPPPDPESRRFLRFSELPRPILGLVGNLEGKTDLALLERIARERPDYQIALIGSTHTHAEMLRLDDHPNVHFFGIVEYPEVKAWIKCFDVALLPHLDTEQTRSMHPLKMLVYAAASVPIVSTQIENLGEFEPFISVAGNHAEFLECVDAAVAGTTDVDGEELAEVVARNAWSNRVDDIMALLVPLLAASR